MIFCIVLENVLPLDRGETTLIYAKDINNRLIAILFQLIRMVIGENLKNIDN